MAKGSYLDLRRHLPSAAFVALLALVLAAFVGIFVYTGIYNIGADAPHSRAVYWALEQVRDRAIIERARDIVPPKDLADPERIATGAGLYAEMCSGCHLAPGMEPSEMSQGLYPQAPQLSRGTDHSSAQQFWIIKHGVKLSAMPAWGKTHNDELIWDMVAFLATLPSLSPAQYQAAVANAPAEHEEMMQEVPDMKASSGHAHPAGADHH